jgi:cytochrome c oxidase accessory protein FixG
MTSILVFSGVFYWIFIWFREQACILVCPYGRLQGVLLDKNSIVIGYDHVRGEPRGKLRRNEARSGGDCIDCNLCVEVCPTGIDIRHGTQLECVNCTACIDACNAVMVKVKKPKGLIRYVSANRITSRTGFRWTRRIIGYSAMLLLLVSIVTSLVSSRTDYDVTVLRTPGMFFQEQPDGGVSNVYDLTVVNKSFGDVRLTVKLLNHEGRVELIGGEIGVPPQGIVEAKFLIILKREDVHSLNTPVTLGIFNGTRMVQTITTSFLGPGRQS